MVASRRRLRFTSFFMIAGLMVVLSVGIAGAQGDDANLRVVHAGHNIGSVDVYIDGELAIEELGYSEITEYLALPAGDHQLQITSSGDTVDEALLDMQVMLESGTPHTVVAIGPVDAPELIVIVDDHSAPPDGMARLSLVNATSDGTDVALSLTDGTSLIEDVPFADASEYIELETGSYDFSVFSTGTEQEIATIPGFSADAGSTYSMFVMGVEGAFEAVAIEDMAAEGTSPVEPTPTEEAGTPAAGESTPTSTVSGTPTVATTPVTTPTATEAPAATATVIPSLPATGSGGTSDGLGMGAVLLGLTALAVALGGALTWRMGLWAPGNRR